MLDVDSSVLVNCFCDATVATLCIENDHALLHGDRDFDAFEARRGLRVWRH